MAQFIYTMHKVRKAHGDKVILDDVTLSFLPGAKIGVVGPNGAGKSSVLKIMAGLDQASNGDARLLAGATRRPAAAGTAARRDQDGPRERRGRGRRPARHAGPLRGGLGRDGRARRRLRLAARRAGRADGEDRARRGLGTRQPHRAGDGRAALPARRRGRSPTCPAASGAGWRCASCCSSSPTCCCSTSRPTTSTPRACSGSSSTWPSTRAPILAVTHDRYFLDNVAEWILELDRGRAYPYEGNYSTYLEKKAERLEVQGKKDQKLQRRLRDELDWVRQNAKGRQTKSKSRLAALRGDGRRGREDPQARLRRDPDPARPAAGQRGRRGQGPRQGLRRRAALGRHLVLACRAAASSASSARTASARPRCSR